MKLSSTQLRVGVLCVNLGLGLGVPAYAAYRYWSLVEDPAARKPRVALVDTNQFIFTDKDGRPADRTANELKFLETQLSPKPPEKPPENITGPTTTKEPVEVAGDDTELKPGKLQEDGWYYAQYLLREAEPLKSWVILRKKDPQAGAPGAAPAPGGSSRVNPRVPTKPVPGRPAPRPGPRGRPGLPQQPGDQISFSIEQRRFVDAEKGVDFMIHSADETQFVYWHIDDPKRTKYALKYESQSHYMKQDSELHKTIAEMGEKPPEDPGAPEKKSYFHARTFDYPKAREEEYEKLLAGEGVDPVETPSRGGLRTIKPREVVESPMGADATAAPMPRPGPISPANKPPQPQPKDLKEAMSSPEMKEALKAMPAADKKMLDALKGVKPAK